MMDDHLCYSTEGAGAGIPSTPDTSLLGAPALTLVG